MEGTILLGLDDQSEDDIRRLIDFLIEIELDLAEFTVLTPFPHTRACDDLHRAGRILSRDWNDYTADKVVFQPKQMSAGRLQELLAYAWETFYRDEPQSLKMSRLFARVIRKEMADGTARPRQSELRGRAFGRSLGGA